MISARKVRQCRRRRLSSANLLQNDACSTAGRALGAVDLARPAADAADVLTDTRSSRRALVARIELRALLPACGGGVLVARIVAHRAASFDSEMSYVNGRVAARAARGA